jgi:ABC-type multidrug transport system ATPase subunit
VTSLSRGMTQRLGLARVLLHEPQVLLLDEPASGLDPRARIEMRRLLKELRGLGKTILVSSHILPELADICNKIGIIEKGKLLFDGDEQSAIRQVRQRTVLSVGVGGGQHLTAKGLLEARFKLTDKSLASLRDVGVPEEALSKLHALKDKELATRDRFLKELATVLDQGELERYQTLLLNHALLEGHPDVAAVEAREDETLAVTLADAVHDGSFIADLLVKNGLRLRLLKEEEIDLEDVFMGITKGITN